MQVFQDNCCKREISSLEVYCTNAPACTTIFTLNNLQVNSIYANFSLITRG